MKSSTHFRDFFGIYYIKATKKPIVMDSCYLLAGVAGIEPASVVLETIILPLYYTPKFRLPKYFNILQAIRQQ